MINILRNDPESGTSCSIARRRGHLDVRSSQGCQGGAQHNVIQTTYQQQHRNSFDTEPKSLAYTPSPLNNDLYPNVNTSVLTILHIMLVSTPTPVRSFSTTRRVKTYLRSIMSKACLSPTVLIHSYRVFSNDTQRQVVTWDSY